MKASEQQKRYIADELLRIRAIRKAGWREYELENLAQYVRDNPSKANRELLCLGAKSFAFDPWGLVRCRACFIVGEFGTGKDLPMLKTMMRDPEWVVRSDAIDTFEEIATDRQLLYLWKVLEVEPHWLVRADIVTYLALRFGESILDRLRGHLSKERRFSRRFAFLRAILVLRPEEVIDEFVKGLGHGDIGIQCRTLAGLREELERSDRMLAYTDSVFRGAQRAEPKMRRHIRREIVDVLIAYGIDPVACLGELEEALSIEPSDPG